LLSIFPKDHKDKDGQPFWSGPKRAPSPITFSVDDDLHASFCQTYSNLIAVALGIEPCNDLNAFKEMAKNAKVGAYKPKKIEVKLPEEEKEGNQA
jgi:ubiquitin-activating enzyme E1